MKLAAIKKLSKKKKDQTNVPVYGGVGYGFYHPVTIPVTDTGTSGGDSGGDGGGGD